MKKIILSILFLFIFSLCNAQTVHYEAIYLNLRLFNDTTQTFDRWVGWEKCKVKIDINLQKLVIYVHANYEQEYDIQSFLEKEEDKIKRISTFQALDTDKNQCIIKLIRFFPTGQEYLHINWQNLEVSYEIKKL